MIVKLRSHPVAGRVHQQVFAGPDADHLQLAGELVLDLGDWQLIGAALLIGAHAFSAHMRVITEGDREVCAAFDDTDVRESAIRLLSH